MKATAWKTKNQGKVIAKLSTLDPETLVVVDGFETSLCPGPVAEVDLVVHCQTVERDEDPLYGNRKFAKEGAPSVWIGWSKDYRGAPS